MARGRHYAKLSLSNAPRLSFSDLCIVTAGKCNWRHSGWSVRLVGFPQCYPACRFLTNKILSCSCVGGVSELKEEGRELSIDLC